MAVKIEISERKNFIRLKTLFFFSPKSDLILTFEASNK